MNHALVMTIIGPDRPGLVESVAAIVAEHGGNWLESRMARLGGQFAGILRVQVPGANQPELTGALRQLESRGLSVIVRPDTLGEPLRQRLENLLEIMGQDRPGIIRQISSVLADYNINVEELETECQSAAMSGETLFKAVARIGIPSDCDIGAVRSRLETIAEDLIVEIRLADVIRGRN